MLHSYNEETRQEEGSVCGEGAGRFPQSSRELCGIDSQRRDRYRPPRVAFKSIAILIPQEVTHSHTFCSVSDSIHSYGCPCLPGILCVQRHMDALWIRSGQKLQEVRAKRYEGFKLTLFLTCLQLFSTYSKLKINVDITVAMRCQCKCKTVHFNSVFYLYSDSLHQRLFHDT